MKALRHILTLSALALASACGDRNSHKSTDLLAAELSTLNLAQPQRDVDVNLARGDLRYICVLGYTADTPGVDITKLDKSQVRCLEGTTDGIESDYHAELNKRARDYAVVYNAALAARHAAATPPNTSLERTRER